VDLTEDDDEMGEAPATPPPKVSGDEDQMDTAEEDDLLHYGIGRDHHDSSSDEDGFQHV